MIAVCSARARRWRSRQFTRDVQLAVGEPADVQVRGVERDVL
jgi:hypothetical protein